MSRRPYDFSKRSWVQSIEVRAYIQSEPFLYQLWEQPDKIDLYEDVKDSWLKIASTDFVNINE